MIAAVENVVLEHEDDVEDHWHDAEHPLDDVEPTPFEGRLAMAYRLDDVLKNTEAASSEVEQDISDWPALSAFSFVVKVDLRHVLNERDESLAVSGSSEELNVLIKISSSHLGQEKS